VPAPSTAAINGTQLYYEMRGEGEPLVLIHGSTLDTRMWDDQFESLATRYRVIRYDLRGYGKSALPSGTPYSHADDLRALLDFLDAPRAHVLGLSMGGRIALHHALTYPAATTSLILVDSALDGHPWSSELRASFDAINRHAEHVGAKAANEMWLRHPLFAPARELPNVRAKLDQIVSEHSGWEWLPDECARGIDPPSIERLHEIQAPTLIVVGERDLPDFLQIGETLVLGIPNAQCAVMTRVGHMSSMENPEEFNAIVLRFLSATASKAK